jgi:hypothetical protein
MASNETRTSTYLDILLELFSVIDQSGSHVMENGHIMTQKYAGRHRPWRFLYCFCSWR